VSEVLAELIYRLSEKMFADTCWRIQAVKYLADTFGLSTIEVMEMLRQARHLPNIAIPVVSEKPKQSDVLIVKQVFRDMKRPNNYRPKARSHYGLAYIEELTPFTQADWDRPVERLNRLHQETKFGIPEQDRVHSLSYFEKKENK